MHKEYDMVDAIHDISPFTINHSNQIRVALHACIPSHNVPIRFYTTFVILTHVYICFNVLCLYMYQSRSDQ